MFASRTLSPTVLFVAGATFIGCARNPYRQYVSPHNSLHTAAPTSRPNRLMDLADVERGMSVEEVLATAGEPDRRGTQPAYVGLFAPTQLVFTYDFGKGLAGKPEATRSVVVFFEERPPQVTAVLSFIPEFQELRRGRVESGRDDRAKPHPKSKNGMP